MDRSFIKENLFVEVSQPFVHSTKGGGVRKGLNGCAVCTNLEEVHDKRFCGMDKSYTSKLILGAKATHVYFVLDNESSLPSVDVFPLPPPAHTLAYRVC